MLAKMVDHSQTTHSMTRFLEIQLKNQTWILILTLALSCVCFSGCDLGTYSKRFNDSTPAPAPAEDETSDEKSMEKKDPPKDDSPKDGPPRVVGKWEIDGESTAAAIRKSIGGQDAVLESGNTFVDAIEKGVFEFDLAQDGTFTCLQVLDGKKANFTGEWVLNGNLLDLNQQFKDGVPERDRLTGTIQGDRLDMTNDAGGLKIPLFFDRAR